jgi:hypothetical protein
LEERLASEDCDPIALVAWVDQQRGEQLYRNETPTAGSPLSRVMHPTQ